MLIPVFISVPSFSHHGHLIRPDHESIRSPAPQAQSRQFAMGALPREQKTRLTQFQGRRSQTNWG